MTILFMDGFDLYGVNGDLGYVYAPGYGGNIRTTGGRFGAGAFQQGGSFANALVAGVTPSPEVWISMAMQFVDTNDLPLIGWIAGTNTPEGMLRYNTVTGTWTALVGTGTTLVTATKLLTGGWHWIDFRVKLDPTAGEVELWADDAQVFLATGLNTIAHSGYTDVIAVSLGVQNVGASNTYYDDLIVYTPGTRLGDSRIETIVPNSDAGPNDGTPSTAGAHYLMVNEAQNNTSNYITVPDTSGDKEVFGTAGISSTPASVWGVGVKLLTEKTDAGSYALEPLVVSNSVEADGSAQQLVTGYGVQQTIFATDPNTSAAWTYTAVNAANIGLKVA
jgi:hypothetical protein